jgi:hypothetical protein
MLDPSGENGKMSVLYSAPGTVIHRTIASRIHPLQPSHPLRKVIVIHNDDCQLMLFGGDNQVLSL